MIRIQNNLGNLIVIIPAYNEEESIGRLLDELHKILPGVNKVVINDGSGDRTAAIAAGHGAVVLDLPCNIGVGGAVQAGFQFALRNGYDYVVRIDADGQHPPSEIPALVAEMEKGEADLIIGSRFGTTVQLVSTRFRYFGIRALSLFLSLICHRRVTDPTSGFWMMGRPLLDYFSKDYPSEYPEPEAIALLCRQGYTFREVPVTFRPRLSGESSIKSWGTFYYALKVGLALVVDRVRIVNVRYSKTCWMKPS